MGDMADEWVNRASDPYAPARALAASLRCGVTDLLISQCACPKHRGGDVDDRPETVGQAFEAAYAGTCVLCDGRIRVGDVIVRLAEEPKSYVHSGRCP